MIEGRYQVLSFNIDGQSSSPNLPEIMVMSSGRYWVGNSSGTWSQRAAGVFFDGPYSSWGCGAVEDDGERLVFRFEQGEVVFRVVFQRQPSVSRLRST